MKLYTYILLAGVLALTSCENEKKDTKVVEVTMATASPMAATSPSSDSQKDKSSENDTLSISVRGYVDVPPEQRLSVSPFYGGYVKNILVLPGTKVKKGEVLFTLQNPEFITLQQQYLETAKQLEYLEQDFKRQMELSKDNISSEKTFKKAESDYQVMKAKASGLKEQLKLLGISTSDLENGSIYTVVKVYAQISGTVTEVNIQKGVFVDVKDVAVKLINMDHLHLELEVFEQEALKVKVGQKILFRIPEIDDKEYNGEVHLVVPAIDMKKRTFLVHGHLDDMKKNKFLPGMYVDAKIRI